MLEKLSKSIGDKIGPIGPKIKYTEKSVLDVLDWFKGKLFPSDEEYIEDFREVFTYEYNNYRKKCIYPKNYDQIIKNGNIKNISKHGEEAKYVLEYNGGRYPLRDISGCEEKEKYSNKEERRYFAIEDLLKDSPNFFIRNTDRTNSQLYKPFGLRLQDTPKYLPVLQCEKSEDGEGLCLSKRGVNKNGEQLYKSWNRKEKTSFFEIRDHNGEMHRWEWLKSLVSVLVVVVPTTCAKMLTNAVTLFPIELGKYLMRTEQPILKVCGKVLFGTGSLVKNSVNFISVLTRTVIVVPLTCNREKYADKYWTKLKYQWKRCGNEIKSDWNMVFSSEGINSNSEHINCGNGVKDKETQEGKTDDHPKETGIQECKLIAIDSWDELNRSRKNDKKDNGHGESHDKGENGKEKSCEELIRILNNQHGGNHDHANGQRKPDPLSSNGQDSPNDQRSNSPPPSYTSPPSTPPPCYQSESGGAQAQTEGEHQRRLAERGKEQIRRAGPVR